MKQVEHNGYKFTRDETTGYYLSACYIDGERKRLHRYIWELENGKIPERHHVHHIDYDKSNNSIDNLQLMIGEEHASLHGTAKTEDEYLAQVERMDHARAYANVWHGSADGVAWHKEHYERMKEKLHQSAEFKCIQCGKTYRTAITGNNKFCSNACKSSFRRNSGVDNIQRECAFCGDVFMVNKYAKQETCSRSCANKLRARKKREVCRV